MARRQKIYYLNDPLKYTRDSSKIDINSNAKLKLQQQSIDFVENFDNDTGFVYDAAKAEFTGGKVQQIDQRNYSNASFEASYNLVINGTRGLGVLTGTPINGATITGSKLDLTGGRSVNYDANLNADSQQTLCIKFKATPNFTGAPPTDYPLITICKSNGDSDNIVMIRLQSSGQLQIFIQDSTGAVITNTLMGIWNNVSGVRYEFGLNVDITTGATRLFVENKVSGDCEQFGGTLVDTGTRDANIAFLNVGGNYNNIQFWDGYIEDLVIFDSVQNVTDYAAGEYSVPDYLYAETSVILPEMEHTLPGTIISFDAFVTIDSNTPHYTIQIGRSGIYLYWNGLAWVASDGTYAQANDALTFNTNISALNVLGEIYGQFKILFGDSNSQMNVDKLTDTVTENSGYLTTNPAILTNETFAAHDMINIVETATKPTGTELKYIIQRDGVNYYVSSGTWTTSNGTYAQSNTAAELNLYLPTFLDNGNNGDIGLLIFLNTGSILTTPILTQIVMNYNYILLQVGVNSWVTLTEADDYLEATFGAATWATLSEVTRLQCLISAFRWIYNYPDVNIPKTSTDEKVKAAQIELAWWIYNYWTEYRDRQSLIAGGVTKFRLSKWSEDLNGQDLPQNIKDILSDLLENTGGVFPTFTREIQG